MNTKSNKPDFSSFTISICETREDLALKDIEYLSRISPTIRIRNTVDLIREVYGEKKAVQVITYEY